MTPGSSPRRLSVGRWLERSLRPIYVLDEKRTILFANAACLDWLAAPASCVVGQRVDYHSWSVPADSVRAATGSPVGLCPSPDVLAAEQGRSEVWCVAVDGAIRRRVAHVYAMFQEGSSRRHLLVLLEEHDIESRPVVDAHPLVMALPGNAGLPGHAGTPVASLHERLFALHRRLQAPYRLESLLGRTPAMQRVRRQVEVAAGTHANVLVTGEAGCGREQVARTIHRLRVENDSALLVPLDCRILDAELLESTVLSVLRGGGSGKPSAPSTLLLLEIDQLERSARAVLRAILERPEFPLRTLATAAASAGSFAACGDEALGALLATLEIPIPSLRERLDDLPLLLQAAVETLNGRGKRQVAGFTAEAMEALMGHPWRGNLDELREVVAEAWTRAGDAWIGLKDLPPIIGWTADAEDFPVVPPEMSSLDDYLASIERELVTRAMQRARGNRAEAARLLGIPRARLLRKLDPPAAGSEVTAAADDEGPVTPDEEATS